MYPLLIYALFVGTGQFKVLNWLCVFSTIYIELNVVNIYAFNYIYVVDS